MSNSSLVQYTKISPNKTFGRNHSIDTITPHCVVGQVSVEQLGALFAKPSRKASSNYGIGKDGKIALFVEEKDRSWCSSNKANDNRAVTIEIASDTKHPFAITDAAYESTVKLMADIAKRNNMKKLLWKADKTLIGHPDKQNITVHRWFANKACPGDYIYDRLGQMADEANKILASYNSGSAQPSSAIQNGFMIEVKVTNLNIRKGPGTNYDKTGIYVRPGFYTITETKNGPGSAKGWGRLKSGIGWVSMDYVIRK